MVGPVTAGRFPRSRKGAAEQQGVIAPDGGAAHRGGELLAKTSTSDVVDGFVAVLARTGDVILTSDVSDITTLTKAARVTVVVTKV